MSQKNVPKSNPKNEYQEMLLLRSNGVFLISGTLEFILQVIKVQEKSHSWPYLREQKLSNFGMKQNQWSKSSVRINDFLTHLMHQIEKSLTELLLSFPL